ncbi:unnamed protein product [Symbiodinium necroappetens]|uniref:Uncharacterized protein n=1 Tax=Symbiodinium necroappetens TaxID=1628268 RepID=A0A813ACX0_9DINO|nr:unnamed protein product [Symbiodinium necroappetens]
MQLRSEDMLDIFAAPLDWELLCTDEEHSLGGSADAEDAGSIDADDDALAMRVPDAHEVASPSSSLEAHAAPADEDPVVSTTAPADDDSLLSSAAPADEDSLVSSPAGADPVDLRSGSAPADEVASPSSARDAHATLADEDEVFGCRVSAFAFRLTLRFTSCFPFRL